MNKKNTLFIILFAVLGVLALQIPLFTLAESKVRLTVFDMFAPISGAFIGTLPGAIAAFVMQLLNFIFKGFDVHNIAAIIRLFPMAFAALYFSKKTKLNFIIPLLAIISFNLNPVGRSVWYYSLFWLIPVVCYFWQDKFLLARSLGATFTAHAVGGAAWIWAFHLPKTFWVGLIPVVAMERIIFALGIAASYLVFNNLLDFLISKNLVKLPFSVNPKYLWTGSRSIKTR